MPRSSSVAERRSPVSVRTRTVLAQATASHPLAPSRAGPTRVAVKVAMRLEPRRRKGTLLKALGTSVPLPVITTAGSAVRGGAVAGDAGPADASPRSAWIAVRTAASGGLSQPIRYGPPTFRYA